MSASIDPSLLGAAATPAAGGDVLDIFPHEVRESMKKLLYIRIISTVTLTLLVWDYLRDFLREVAIWKDLFGRKKEERRSRLTLIAFLIQRYTVLFAATFGEPLVFGGGPGTPCKALTRGVFIMNAISSTAIAFVFAKRTIAICPYSPRLHIVLYCCVPIIGGCYVAAVTQYTAHNILVGLQGCHCAMDIRLSHAVVRTLGFLASLVFDVIIFLITVSRLWRVQGDVSQSMLKHSLVYFLGACGIHTFTVAMVIRNDDPATGAMPIGITLALTSCLVSRMVFGLRDHAQRPQHIPFQGGSGQFSGKTQEAGAVSWRASTTPPTSPVRLEDINVINRRASLRDTSRESSDALPSTERHKRLKLLPLRPDTASSFESSSTKAESIKSAKRTKPPVEDKVELLIPGPYTAPRPKRAPVRRGSPSYQGTRAGVFPAELPGDFRYYDARVEEEEDRISILERPASALTRQPSNSNL